MIVRIMYTRRKSCARPNELIQENKGARSGLRREVTKPAGPRLSWRLPKWGRLAYPPDGGRMLTSGPRDGPCASVAVYRNMPMTVQARTNRLFCKHQHVRIDGVNWTPELFLPIPISSLGFRDLYCVILHDVLLDRSELRVSHFGRLLPLAVIGDGSVRDCRERQSEY